MAYATRLLAGALVGGAAGLLVAMVRNRAAATPTPPSSDVPVVEPTRPTPVPTVDSVGRTFVVTTDEMGDPLGSRAVLTPRVDQLHVQMPPEAPDGSTFVWSVEPLGTLSVVVEDVFEHGPQQRLVVRIPNDVPHGPLAKLHVEIRNAEGVVWEPQGTFEILAGFSP